MDRLKYSLSFSWNPGNKQESGLVYNRSFVRSIGYQINCNFFYVPWIGNNYKSWNACNTNVSLPNPMGGIRICVKLFVQNREKKFVQDIYTHIRYNKSTRLGITERKGDE